MKTAGYPSKSKINEPVSKSLRQAADPRVRSGLYASFLEIQSALGNRKLCKLLASAVSREASSPSGLGAPTRRSEEGQRESEIRAGDGVQMANRTGKVTLQRKCACGGSPAPTGECEECRAKRLQGKAANGLVSKEMPPVVHEVLGGAGRPLDATTRRFFESRFGRDLSSVRVHTDAKAAESAQAVQAHAYTVGKDVVFGSNQFAPATHQGRELLAHELAHTVQQRNASGSVVSAEQGGILESSAVTAGRDISSGGVVSRNLPACGRQIQRDPDQKSSLEE